MYVQGDKPNEWMSALDWQDKLINFRPNFSFTNIQTDRFNGDRGQIIIKHNDFTYALYYKYGDYQGYDIPILLNLDTGKSRVIDTFKNHNGAKYDRTTAKQFNELISGKQILNI
jgi:hypothetical protein